MGFNFTSDLSGLRNELLASLKELRNDAEKEGKKVGRVVGESVVSGIRDSVEDIPPTIEEQIEEAQSQLRSSKRIFENTLKDFPRIMSRAFKEFNFDELADSGRKLRNSLRRVQNAMQQLAEFGVDVDNSWITEMQQQVQALGESSHTIQENFSQDTKKMADDLNMLVRKIKSRTRDMDLSDIKIGLNLVQELRQLDQYSRQIKETFKNIRASFYSLGEISGFEDVLTAFQQNPGDLESIDWGFGKASERRALLQEERQIIDQLKTIGRLRSMSTAADNFKTSKINIFDGTFTNEELEKRIPLLERLLTITHEYAALTRSKSLQLHDDSIAGVSNIDYTLKETIRSNGEELKSRQAMTDAITGQSQALSENTRAVQENGEAKEEMPAQQPADASTAAIQRETKAIETNTQATEENIEAKKKPSRIKLREFTKEEYDAHTEKYETEHDGEVEFVEDTVDLIRSASEFGTRFAIDMETSCKRARDAVKRFFSVFDLNEYPQIVGWKDSILESMEDGIFSLTETYNGMNTGDFSWGIEQPDENHFYVFLNFLDVAKDKEEAYWNWKQEEFKKRDEGLLKQDLLLSEITQKEEQLQALRKPNFDDYDNTFTYYQAQIEYLEQERSILQDIDNLRKQLSAIPQKYKKNGVEGYYTPYKLEENANNIEKFKKQIELEKLDARTTSIRTAVPIQPTVEPNAVEGAIQQNTGNQPVEVSVTPVIEQTVATGSSNTEAPIASAANIEPTQLELFDRGYSEFVQDMYQLDPSGQLYSKLQQRMQDIRSQVEQGMLDACDAYVALSQEMAQVYTEMTPPTQEIRKMSIQEYTKFMKGIDLNKLFADWGIDKENQGAIRDAFTELGNIIVSKEKSDKSDVDIKGQIENISKLILKYAKEPKGIIEDSSSWILDELAGGIYYDEADVKNIGKEHFQALKSQIKGKLFMTKTPDAKNLGIDSFFTALSEPLQSLIASTWEQNHGYKFEANKASILEGIASVYQFAKTNQAQKGQMEFGKLQSPDAIESITNNINTLIDTAISNAEQLVGSARALGDTAERAAVQIEEQASANSNLANTSQNAATAIEQSTDRIEEQADLLSGVSINSLGGNTSAAIARARLAKNNKGPVIDLSGVYSTGDLEAQLQASAKKIIGGNDLTFGKIYLDDGIASIKLFNKELGKTVVDWYEIIEATEDGQQSQVKYLKSTLAYDDEAANRYNTAQEKKIADSNNWIIQQLGKLDRQEISYKYSGKKINGETPVYHTNDDRYFGKTIDQLAGDIRGRLETAMNGALTESIKNEIRDAMRILGNEIKIEQSNVWVKGRLSAQEITEAKATNEFKLQAFEEKAKNNNVFTQLERDIISMREALNSVTEEDSSGLNSFIDKLRTAEAHLSAEIQKNQGAEKEQSNYKKAEQALERLYTARKDLAKLEAEGKTDAELSRRIKDLEEEARIAENRLKTEKSMGDILERRSILEGELANVKKQAEADQAVKKKAADEKQATEQLRSIYSERMKIQKELNILDSQLNNLKLKDKGTGEYAQQIDDYQTLKSSKVAELRELEDRIKAIQSLDGYNGKNGFAAFLEYCRDNAILTADEIQELNKVLMQSEHIAQNFQIASSQQQLDANKKSFEELIRLQKQYNEADYNWQQADIRGEDKAPYNAQMESYVQRMQEIRKEIKLTAEQQLELDKINNKHQKKKTQLLSSSEATEAKKANQEYDKLIRLQTQLYASKMKLAALESKGDTSSAEWLKVSRLVEEREAQYQASLEVLKGNERINDALEREIRLEAEVSKFRQDSANKQAKQQNEDELKQYQSRQNERIRIATQENYKYVGGKTADDQVELNNLAEQLRKEEESAQQKADNLKDIYDRLLETQKNLYTVQDRMNNLTLKDNGTGIYSKPLSALQDRKSALWADMRSIEAEINNALSQGAGTSNGLYLDVDLNYNPIEKFFTYTREQAILTTEEIQKFYDALGQSENLGFNFASKVTEKIQPFVENITLLRKMFADGIIDGGADKNANLVNNLFGASGVSAKFSSLIQQFRNNPDNTANASELLEFVKANEQYIDSIIKAASAESKYFAGKSKSQSGETMYGMDLGSDAQNAKIDSARQALEEYVNTFAEGKGIITDFTTAANGISQISFSALDKGTGQFRTFTAEMGQFTDNIYRTETTLNGLASGTDAAKKSVAALATVMGQLNGVSGAEDQIQALFQKYQDLQNLINSKGKSQDVGDQNTLKAKATEVDNLRKKVEKLIKEWAKAQAGLGDGSLTPLGSIDKNGNIQEQMWENIKSGADGARASFVGFDEKTNTLTYTLTNADKTVTTMTAHMHGLNGAVTAQRGKTETLKTGWQEFTGALNGAAKGIGQYLGRAFSMWAIVGQVKQGFNAVRQIDAALTELKKVTDETEASYQKFLNTASQTAGKIGSTVSDFTQATANFARLGYTMEESAKMAETAIVYKNVAD